MNTPPVVLVIRDGWGENPHADQDAFNAVKLARTPCDDRLRASCPWTLIKTSGLDVGLPPGTMGNSEVGHQNIGAGRVVAQLIVRITSAIDDGSFFEMPELHAAFDHARKTGGAVHLMGLVSEGQVHADRHHLQALIDFAARADFPGDRLFVHAFTDGRDTGPFSGRGSVAAVDRHLTSVGRGRIASVIGRYYAMDRDHRWPRTEIAYACLTGRGDDVRTAATADAAFAAAYDAPPDAPLQGDEFIEPTRITRAGGNARVRSGDAVIFFNFRGDRPRQLVRAFVLPDEAWAEVPRGGFDRGERLTNLHFATMTSYEEGLPVEVLFARPPRLTDILGQVVAGTGRTQFRCAETEKFAHVTYFFNDYREAPFDGERRRLIPSPTEVGTYDQKPEMSAPGVAEAVRERLLSGDVEPLLIVNLANADMVGHTGDLAATIDAVEAVDAAVATILEAAGRVEASLIITADHGNAEQMWDPATDAPHTAHTVYDVPLFVAGPGGRGRTLHEDGRLADIAPTLLELMSLPAPAAMTGRSLLMPPADRP